MGMAAAAVISVLSYHPELLEEIFSHLDFRSIKTVCLVSKLWKTVAESSKYWSRASLKVKRHNCSEVILSTRINIVPAVRLLGSLTADQLTAIYQMLDERKPDTLKELHLIRIDQSNVSSEVLASCIARMEKVTLFGCGVSGISPDQLTAIYQ